jgi:uncharacterized protein YgiM (DUF1202 family)
MKAILACAAFLLLFQSAWSIERIEPTLYICYAREIVLHKEPTAASEAAGHLLFGMPAVALAKHNDWFGVYVKGGGKGWVQTSDMVTQKDFAAQYPHLAVNDAYVAQLIKESVQATSKKRDDSRLSEIKFMKVKGESEEIYVRRDNVVIRSKPTLNARPIRNTFQGEAFVVAGMVRGFYKIEYDEGKFGWISEDMVSPDTLEYMISIENAAGSPKEASIYVLTTPEEKAPIMARARRDFTYEILSEKDKFYQIRLDSLRTGWIPSNELRITRPGLKNPLPSAESPIAAPSGAAPTGAVSAQPLTPSPAPVPAKAAPVPAPAAQPPAVVAPPVSAPVPPAPAPVAAPVAPQPAASPLPAPPPPAPPAPVETLSVKTAIETAPVSTPFTKLDSLKTLQNQEKVKQKELEKMQAEAKQDSLAIKGRIETLKVTKMKELDSLRQALNNRFKFMKDSLAAEKEKYLKFQNSVETLAKLQKQKEALPAEITKLHGQAKDTRERAQNLKELAQFEFDVDTSARAKDSLVKLARVLDSTAGNKEMVLKSIDAEIASLNTIKPEAAAREVSLIDSAEKVLPAVQKNEFTALLQKQAALDQMLAQAKTQLTVDARDRLKKIGTDLKAETALLKKIETETTALEKELRKKR